MTERLYVRQISDQHWQWRLLFANGEWDGDIYAGTIELLAESLSQTNLPLCVLLPGQQAVARQMPVDSVEKKHLAKLLPYEMEEQLIDPVEELHFCFGNIANGSVNLIYLDAGQVAKTLQDFARTHGEVQQILPDYLLLQQGRHAGIIVLDGEQVLAKFGDSIGFAVEVNVAPLVLESLGKEISLGQSALLLVAGSEDELEVLCSCLPRSWLDDEELEIHQRVAGYWDCIDPQLTASAPNLRSGAFARQLPIARWWELWKTPAYFVAASFVLALLVNFGAYLGAKNEGKAIKRQIEQVYLQAVPKGRKGDEENRLQSILRKGGDSGAKPTNLVVLLSGLAQTLSAQQGIQLSNFRYNGEQHELQINIEVKGLGELARFREVLAGNGLQSGSPRTSRQGEIYRANMKISEAN